MKEEGIMTVAVIGNIAASKSTVCEGLARAGWTYIPEPTDAPEWKETIDLFYDDQERWAFLFQITAFALRARLWREVVSGLHGPSETVVVERSVFDDWLIFARSLYRQRKMLKVEYDAYVRIFHELPHSVLVKPAAIIYLKIAPELALERIGQRGRPEEQGIPLEYLQHLDEAHEEYVREMQADGVKVFTVDASQRKEDVLAAALRCLTIVAPVVPDDELRRMAFIEDSESYEASRR